MMAPTTEEVHELAFGDNLQELRRAQGLTQEQFAEELEVSRQAVSKWESGKGYPEMEKLLYICRRYGTTLNALFDMDAPCSLRAQEVKLPRRSWTATVGGFFSNLSPLYRALCVVFIAVLAISALIIGLLAKGRSNDMLLYIWIGAIVLFGIVEAATAGLTSIWFVLGGVAGLITAVCGGELWLQITLFLVVSVAALIATRPLVKRLSSGKSVATNADRVLGGTARVTETIDNTVPCGAVYIDGKTWSARSESGAVIPEGVLVTVRRMEGVKLFVETQV